MPPLETMDREQTAVWWPKSGVDAYGRTAAGDPVELAVRWVAGRRDVVNADGQVVGVDATVVLDRDVSVDDLMWQGALADLPGTTHTPEAGVMQVKTFDKTPDLKGRNVRREATLAYYSDTFPG